MASTRKPIDAISVTSLGWNGKTTEKIVLDSVWVIVKNVEMLEEQGNS